MSFDYDKIKQDEEGGTYWASYSDLFMVLSLVFLLLYVVANLRGGTQSIMQGMEFQELARERDDLKQQIKVFNTLKDNYLETGATDSEQKNYEELMEKLVLLKEEAKEEKEDLRQQAFENERKEKALNKYQQMIRNIVNSNMISTARIKRRDRVITKRNVQIKENKKEISKLHDNVVKREQEVKKSEKEIKKMNVKLNLKIKQLKNSYLSNKITKKKMKERVKRLKLENIKEVARMKEVNKKTKQEIKKINTVLNKSKEQLQQARQKLQKQGQKLSNLVKEKNKFRKKIKKINVEFDKKIKAEQAALNAEIRRQKLTAKAKAKKLADLKRRTVRERRKLASAIKKLESESDSIQKDLDKTLLEKNKISKKARTLAGSNKKLSRNVARLKVIANRKKKLIQRITRNLKRAGIKASVDRRSGDVVISFGREYFDTGKAALKPRMRQILKKFMPAYSASLLNDPETAKNISSVEIVGFASPTYKGKYVNPKSLKASNKKAINYNLDLSYYRARSIFDYVFDTTKMTYKHQNNLLSLVKVTGRSFLAEGASTSEAKNMNQKQYCAKYDCKKSQRVTIKFNMKP